MSLPQETKLFDFQVNGFGGVDFQSDSLTVEEMRHAVATLGEHRMTAIFFTLITDSVDALCRKLERIEKLRTSDETIAAAVRGYHLEGPWISTEAGYHGAHPKEHAIAPSLGDYRRLRDAAGGNLKLITLAPEVDGCEMIMELCQIFINNVEKSKKNLRAFKRNQAIDKIIWIKISFSVNFI